MDKQTIATYFKDLQDSICAGLEEADGEGFFREDPWERAAGGGGRTRIIEGRHIEKGGVNFSAVFGPMQEKVSSMLEVTPGAFFASGVSIVLHPRNPMAPIIHMNVRYFETQGGAWWFGGGIDLTPHYIIPEEVLEFHQQLKAVCDGFHPDFYPSFSAWADRYFFLPHRNELRGVGGIFFDRLNETTGLDKKTCLNFTLAVGRAFLPLYLPLLHRHKNDPYTREHSRWQSLRRGRYTEFNLIWDKGTKFGLETDGRTESILMSLPPTAQWTYDVRPEPGSPEAQTQYWLMHPDSQLQLRGMAPEAAPSVTQD